MARYRLVPESGNSKTGRIPVVYADRSTCPTSCPFYREDGSVCYGQEFRITRKWDEAANGDDWTGLLDGLRRAVRKGRPWRFGIVGDLPTRADGSLDGHKLYQLRQLRGDGWAYTHHDLLSASNRETVLALHAESGFVLNQSCDSLEQAEACLDAGIPAVMVGPADFSRPVVTERGSILTPCPATIKTAGKKPVTCADCTLCRGSALTRTRRRVVIVFPAHGPRSKRTAQAMGEANLREVLS